MSPAVEHPGSSTVQPKNKAPTDEGCRQGHWFRRPTYHPTPGSDQHRLWVGVNWPNREKHGGQTVQAGFGIGGRWGVHIDQNVLADRQKTAEVLLHEALHLFDNTHPDDDCYQVGSKIRYRTSPFKEVPQCVKSECHASWA